MIKVQINQIRRNGLVIPGGWSVQIPEIGMLHDADELWGSVFAGEAGPAREDIYDEIMQECFNAGFLHGLKQSVMNFAWRYAEKYPELHQKMNLYPGTGFVLQGFNPEIAATYYLPVRGVGKESGIDEELERMAQNA